MNNPEIWVVVHDDHRITAHDTQDAAINAAIDDEAPWIEEVTINRSQEPTGWPSDAEQQPEAELPTPTRPERSHRRSWVAPPSLTIRGAWVDPSNGPEAA